MDINWIKRVWIKKSGIKKTAIKRAGLFIAAALFGPTAYASEELNLYNWVDYTPPELIKKFEQETGIKVNLDTYDSNETLLAKLKSGAAGYDIIVPSGHFVSIMISEGLLEKINTQAMPNYQNLDPRWEKLPWDPTQEYSVPYHTGSSSFSVNMEHYNGPGDSLREFFEPNASASGKIQVFRSPGEVIPLALIYLGYDQCSENPKELKQAMTLLKKQKDHVKVYNSETIISNLASGEVIMSNNWNGYSNKARVQSGVSKLKYVYPKEGIFVWVDTLAIPKGAPNKANAEKFINFMLDAEHGAIAAMSNYQDSPLKPDVIAPYLDDNLANAYEFILPTDIPIHFSETCSPKAIKLFDRVWTKLMQ